MPEASFPQHQAGSRNGGPGGEMATPAPVNPMGERHTPVRMFTTGPLEPQHSPPNKRSAATWMPIRARKAFKGSPEREKIKIYQHSTRQLYPSIIGTLVQTIFDARIRQGY
jgi:hypothetical protein